VKREAGMLFRFLELLFQFSIIDIIVSNKRDLVDLYFGFRTDSNFQFDAVFVQSIAFLDDFNFCIKKSFFNEILFYSELGISNHRIVYDFSTNQRQVFFKARLLSFIDTCKIESCES
jgi:hypothetical protein